MNVNKVNEIPKREYRFTMSDETKQYLAYLNEMSVGEVLEVSPETFSNKSVEVQLREIRDRLKTASKKVNAEFLIKRRANKYYVKKLSEQNEQSKSSDSKIRLRELENAY